jgi:hypothetical protein
MSVVIIIIIIIVIKSGQANIGASQALMTLCARNITNALRSGVHVRGVRGAATKHQMRKMYHGYLLSKRRYRVRGCVFVFGVKGGIMAFYRYAIVYVPKPLYSPIRQSCN